MNRGYGGQERRPIIRSTAGVETPGYGSEEAIRDSARMVSAIELGELNESAGLLTRVDRKYFVPAKTFRALIAELGSFRVLEIDGQRSFDYESVYFDTPDLLTYRAHLQRRRRRFKARTRTYVDSGLCMFEVKTVGSRGATVKDRIKHPVADRAVLTGQAHEFLAQILRNAYDQPVPPGLQPMLINLYRRTTFASPVEGSRLTCDVSLSCHTERASMSDRGQHVLVESKSANGAGEADQMLRQLGVRPISVSKYALGIGALHPELPSNPWHRTLHRYFEPPEPDHPDVPSLPLSTVDSGRRELPSARCYRLGNPGGDQDRGGSAMDPRCRAPRSPRCRPPSGPDPLPGHPSPSRYETEHRDDHDTHNHAHIDTHSEALTAGHDRDHVARRRGLDCAC